MGKDLKGFSIPAMITPFHEDDTYPTHEDTYGKGGYRSVSTIAERDAIPDERLKNGCKIYVEENEKEYTYKPDGSWEQSKADEIFDGDKPLVTPVFVNDSWEFKKNDGTVVTAASLGVTGHKNPIIEIGYKAKWTSSYKWNALLGNKNPTEIGNGSNFSVLPENGIVSPPISIDNVTSNTTFYAKIAAKQTGLIADENGKVKPATGLDVTQCSQSISFQHRAYYGAFTLSGNLVDNIKSLGNSLQSGKSKTISGVSTTISQLYAYAYPASLGNLSTIIQDGAMPVLGAFDKYTFPITNDAGVVISYNIYVSKNKGAFTNVTLQFT